MKTGVQAGVQAGVKEVRVSVGTGVEAEVRAGMSAEKCSMLPELTPE